ncbi:hypothetical protein B6A42_26555 (plasmid) [Vibrio coralliilyticus]|nr:hypothetical protein B6A42_26555 [Vibrio coralliilyticus]
MNKYNIYIVNNFSSKKTFWCFLEEPESKIAEEVYANSSAHLSVRSQKESPHSTNHFSIPLQYRVKAGANNEAVGLNVEVDSSTYQNVDIGDLVDVDFTFSDDYEGPSSQLESNGADSSTEIDIKTNDFDFHDERKYGWFGSLTYGVQSANGFIGLTWAPQASQTYRIAPKVSFYIATGSFRSGELADITQISSDAASVTESDFDDAFNCTVTYTERGGWLVEPGKPKSDSYALSQLIASHSMLASAHSKLIDLYQDEGIEAVNATKQEKRISAGIQFDKRRGSVVDDMTDSSYITGTIDITKAIAAGFVFMVASGIELKITRTSADGVKIRFKYDGSKSVEAIRQAFEAGKAIIFKK